MQGGRDAGRQTKEVAVRTALASASYAGIAHALKPAEYCAGESQENIDAIRSFYDAWNLGDLDRLFEYFDPDIEWCLPEGGINTGTYRGHDAVRQLMESYLDAFDYFRMEPERFFEAEDGRIVVFIRSPGRGKESGVEVEVRTAHTWTMRNGKALRCEILTDRAEALKAAGLSE